MLPVTRLITLSALLTLALPQVASAAQALPGPPSKNPHAPVSAKDKARVQVALAAVEAFLKRPLPKALAGHAHGRPSGMFQSKSLACMRKASCWMKDKAFVRELTHLHHRHGQLVTWRHAHIVPWSFQRYKRRTAGRAKIRSRGAMKPASIKPAFALKRDEYVVHMYVRYAKTNRWFHLDVILAEDAKGNVSFRHFYTTHMRMRGHKLPPGVVC